MVGGAFRAMGATESDLWEVPELRPELDGAGSDGSILSTAGVPNLGIAARLGGLSRTLAQPAAGAAQVQQALGAALLTRYGTYHCVPSKASVGPC